MIKLNNKNITYVALADSPNSIKAPKEIWYADSNNSVKLVYRRKDTLIEGEDYEKYHWLNGDGSAYIDTNIIVPTEKFVCVTRLLNREIRTSPVSFLAFTVRQEQVAVPPFISVNPRTDEQRYYVDLTNPRSYVPFDSGLFDINITMSSASTLQGDLMFFRSKNLNFGNSPWIGDISTFSLTSLDSTFRVKMQPCKLLKPIPKWLDANGIRRQVGECGMIDLVSGKFYGNVNSNGTFTVENYYERKEWLVGDGSAYIDTGHNVNEDLDYETKVHLLPNTYLFWYRSGSPWIDQTMVARSNTSIIGARVAKNSTTVNVDDIANVDVQWNNDEVSINGVNYTPSNRAVTFNYELYLFYGHLADTTLSDYSTNNVKCAYFRFLDSNRDYIQNLIPCTLTMDLPASMDANNIARTKGTSGMWDLVSDRFYGNVANSGTFKAVNLAEGVDYEVHQWLVGDGTAYINTQIPTSKIVDYDITFQDLLPLTYLEGIFGARKNAYEENLSIMTVTPQGTTSEKLCFDFGNYVQNRVEIVDDFNEHRAKWNGAELFVDGVKVADRSFVSQSSRNALLFKVFNYGGNSAFHGKIANLTISGKCNFTPCKLLRSIPSKYDANGIARNAGECGMYDTVNDVFYGNVASSGVFSVEDDS